MIDWPNALVGFALGFLSAVPFWLADRRHAREERRRDALAQWTAAAKQIELLLYNRATTAHDFYVVRVSHPIDLWRSILGPDDFRALERLENAWNAAELWARHVQDGTAAADRLETAVQERADASREFANLSRRRQSESYNVVTNAEQRAQLRRDYLRHPLGTWHRERHNRRIRRESGPAGT